MCLDYLIDDEFPDEGEGYKMVYRRGPKSYKSPFRFFYFSPNETYFSSGQILLGCSESLQKYNSGFHIFASKKEAMHDIENNFDRESTVILTKCRYKGLLAKGKWWNNTILVVQELEILEEV